MSPKTNWLKILCLVTLFGLTVVVSGCGGNITLKGNEDQLASKTVTAGTKEVIYPDATPSVSDGKVIYAKLKCAECHSDSGEPVAGKTTVNLADKNWSHKTKPTELYEFLNFGKPGVDHPVLSTTGDLTRRDVWNLAFYTRAIGQPLLNDEDQLAVDAVFGSNCAVCHGKKGYGDGPLSKNMEPVPANFQNKARFYDRSDDVLYDHIANGIRWEGMPNFLGKEDKAKGLKFDEAYIWKLVQYVRHFHETNEATLVAGKTAPQTK
jgi:mono/diheme cytochrome c family protein